jgi:predicted nucleic acid-binding protein
MTYFDTDVLVNAILIQDLDRHNRALSRIEKSIKDDSFIISSVTLQELVFVLGKLKIESVVIRKTYEFYSPLALYGLDRNIFKRAFEIAEKLSFIHINDALHLACAEKYARSIVTFDKDDFRKLRKHTAILVEILES